MLIKCTYDSKSRTLNRFHTETGGRFVFHDDTVARFRTGVKFSPRCDNRSELTPGRLAPA